jgi:antitoxin component of RelBE/YafQ-DinJ toxin-antitoxin module
MDFIGPLPITKHGYDGILVIVDALTKAAALEPIKFTHSAEDIAKIFIKRIISHHSLPRKIISDRDPRFSGRFWKAIFKMLGMQIALSTAFHPQSDGLTEWMNQSLETGLCTFINGSQDNWDDLLPMAEFAINSSVNISTGVTPFKMIYGKDARLPIDLNLDSNTPAAVNFIKFMEETINQAHDNIVKAQASQKTQADKHRRDHQFKIRDKVLLSSRNLNLPSMHSCKLAPRWIRPFTIKVQKHKDSFELNLPNSYRIYPTFHVNLLKPYQENDDIEFPDRHQDPPEPLIINNQQEYEVEEILKK